MRKTKIVCTLGPSSSDETTLKKMLLAGMNVARLNFSHGTHEGHRQTIQRFRKVREELGIPAAVLLDTKGPEIRTGNFANGEEILKEGIYPYHTACFRHFPESFRHIQGSSQRSEARQPGPYKRREDSHKS